jgi:deferrochelatase/peroxidase EfeB
MTDDDFVSFDLATDRRDELVDLLRAWTDVARRMAEGRDAGPVGAVAGPVDAGRAAARSPRRCRRAAQRRGHRHPGVRQRPAGRRPRHPQPGPYRLRGGHRSLVPARLRPHLVDQPHAGHAAQPDGFKDGTNNLKAEDTALLDKHVWVQPGDGPDWMTGGSYLVARRIRMMIETWDRTNLAEQQTIIGRFKGIGAPLTGRQEFDELDFGASGEDNHPVIAPEAHVRLAHPSMNNDARMLRRGDNFVDGSDGLGRLDAGLVFLAYQRDPHTQFVPVQNNLARSDVLNEYICHVGSALFACPPGVRAVGWWGQALFA